MRSTILTLVIAAGMIGVYVMYPKVTPVITQKLQGAKLPVLSKSFALPSGGQSLPSRSDTGEVMGAMTKAKGVFDALTGQGATVGKTVVSALTTTPSSQQEVIDVSKVVAGMANQVEGIPSHILEQAKVEYCKQVLQQATKSASPQ